MTDILVIGGGPAGLTAAIYARRNGKTVLVLEKGTFGGQITYSPKIENYPGFSEISGAELADRMMEQALSLGADIEMETAVSIEKDNDFHVTTEDGNRYDAHAVIIATGVKHRMLGLPDEETLIGNGISFCAVCDGDFYAGRDVAVIGGGNSALQEALLLSDTCKSVTIVQNLPEITGEPALWEALQSRSNVRALFSTTVQSYRSDENGLNGLILQNESGETTELSIDGVFIAIGLIPANEPFAQIAGLSEGGYIDSDETCLTATKGLFAAGDCRVKSIRQITTAVADGACAALAACRYINAL